MQKDPTTGSGKSTFLKQTLEEIAKRGEVAVVYDPVGEMTEIFFRQERGDQILNPLDERCPYIDIPGEIGEENEALNLAERINLAEAFFPGSGNPGEFFINSAKKIFTFLLKLPQEEMIKVLGNSEKILELVSQDLNEREIEALLDPEARGQHTGIMGTLSLIVNSLKLLPEKGNKEFRFREWAKKRGPGWLFITGTHSTRAALRPLQSVFFHLLIRKCLNKVDNPMMFVLDELQTLEKLPVLETCLTEARKYQCKFIFGCQDRSQIDERYGKIANTILSQPNIKIFLRVGEVETAEWVSRSIGEVEIEKEKSSHTVTPEDKNSISYSSGDKIRKLLLASEIMNLEKLEGYLKYGNFIVKLKLKPKDFPKVTEAFIARAEKKKEPAKSNPVKEKEVSPSSAGSSSNSTNKDNNKETNNQNNVPKKPNKQNPPKDKSVISPKENNTSTNNIAENKRPKEGSKDHAKSNNKGDDIDIIY